MKTVLVLALAIFGGSHAFAQASVLNAASFDPAQPIAPGSFVAAFGPNLCSQTMTGTLVGPGQFPATLGGCSVTVNGAAAMMQYVSSGQVNFIMPAGVNPGQATVMVHDGSRVTTGNALAGPTGPGMFALNGMGMGEGAMLNGDVWRTPPFSTSTDGHPTVVAIYVTGMDITTNPTVTVGGMAADVPWFGNVAGYPGLQQINILLPATMAGAGRVPVMVTSNGQASNVTFMHILPTSSMMQGMPGWGQGMMVSDNMPRAHELSDMAFNASNNTALVTDENDDVVRVISIASKFTTATITLPNGSQAHAIAVNAAGSLAAVALSAKASIALIDLSQNKVISTIATGYYPSGVAFAGSNLWVTNSALGTVSVIDTNSGAITQNVNAAFGASGIAVGSGKAVVANMQAGSITLVDLVNFSISTVALPAGSRPREVAVSADKAVITTPMTNGFLILDLVSKAVTPVKLGAPSAMGAGAVAINGNNIYIANQMTSNVTVADLDSGAVVKTFPVDPGPAALAVDVSNNELLVLAEGTGTLDAVDMGGYAMVGRMDGGSTERQGSFMMPLVSSIAPAIGQAGTSFTLTIKGSGFQGVEGVEFHVADTGGAMGGGMGMGQGDASVKVSNFQTNSDGTQITAAVQILSSAAAGTRQVRLETTYGEVMGMMNNTVFTVTK